MKIQRILVLVLALSQPAAAYFSTLGDTSVLMDQSRNPLMTPATYAFGIWGVITLGSVVYALFQILPVAKNKLYDQIAWPMSAVFLGFSAWLYFAQLEWLLTTIVVFIAIGYSLWKAYSKIVRSYYSGELNLFEKIFVYGTVSLYFGWATVAIFANIAATIKFYGADDTTLVGIVWQSAILLVATGTAVYFIKKAQGSWPYAGTILWALIAVIVGTLERGAVAMPLTVVSALASLVVLGYTLSFSKKVK